MEGKATLTLTDAKSGRVVKKVTEHNLVTDAVKRILNPPVYAMLYSFNFPNFINNVMPASRLFSTSSLTTLAGRSTTSPAAI